MSSVASCRTASCSRTRCRSRASVTRARLSWSSSSDLASFIGWAPRRSAVASPRAHHTGGVGPSLSRSRRAIHTVRWTAVRKAPTAMIQSTAVITLPSVQPCHRASGRVEETGQAGEDQALRPLHEAAGARDVDRLPPRLRVADEERRGEGGPREGRAVGRRAQVPGEAQEGEGLDEAVEGGVDELAVGRGQLPARGRRGRRGCRRPRRGRWPSPRPPPAPRR